MGNHNGKPLGLERVLNYLLYMQKALEKGETWKYKVVRILYILNPIKPDYVQSSGEYLNSCRKYKPTLV